MPRVDLNLHHEYTMETSCFLSCLSKYKGTCGNSRGVTESVRLEDCDESITNHLNSCHLSRETLTESQLILARAGIFDFPVSKLSETMICPKHRHTLGKYWKQRRPCQYPTHKGGKKAVKTRDVVNVTMAKEILKLQQVVVPIGSGLLSTFSHFILSYYLGELTELIFPAFSVFLFGESAAYLQLSYFNSSKCYSFLQNKTNFINRNIRESVCNAMKCNSKFIWYFFVLVICSACRKNHKLKVAIEQSP